MQRFNRAATAAAANVPELTGDVGSEIVAGACAYMHGTRRLTSVFLLRRCSKLGVYMQSRKRKKYPFT